MLVVNVTRNPGGSLTITHGRREIEVSRERFASLANTDPRTYRALKYAGATALVNVDRVVRLDEGARWDAYLDSEEGRYAIGRTKARG